MDAVPVALMPGGIRSYLVDAIEEGGGQVVPAHEAEALVWTDPHDPDGLQQVLQQHPRIRWVQLPWAGIEPLRDVLDEDRIWTCGKGVYGAEVAEHALALALAGMRGIAQYARATGWTRPMGRSLFGASVTILGGGGLTTDLVQLLSPFRCRITVLRRQPEPFPGAAFTGTLDDLPRVRLSRTSSSSPWR